MRRHLQRLAYHAVYTEGNWPGQRLRFLRNLSSSDWVCLYGPNYQYSNDYIHAHRHSFSATPRCMARVSNLVEEAAEIMQRTTTWHMRLVGSMVPTTLRELSGKGRFCLRLRRHLRKHALTPPLRGLCDGHMLEALYEQLQKRKMLNGRSQLTCDLTGSTVMAQLRDSLKCVGMELNEDLQPSALRCLRDAIGKADMRQLWNALSARKRVAYVTGCVLSIGTQLSINILLTMLATSLLVTIVGKTLALASLMYGCSFALRISTTACARLTRAHMGAQSSSIVAYRSLSENLLQRTRQLRNDVAQRLGWRMPSSKQQWINVDGIRVEAREYASASFNWHTRHDPRHAVEPAWLAAAADRTQRITDLVYGADTVSSKLLGRLIRKAYCAHGAFEQKAGVTANHLCGYDWRVTEARTARLGAFRLSLASWVGIGGAETLGACLGCFAVSAAWTGLSKATGGLGSFVLIHGTAVIVPLSSALVGAIGWTTSLWAEVMLRHGQSRAQLVLASRNGNLSR